MILFFVSFFAFLLAGFGLGGGVLLIPVLTNFFSFKQVDAQYIALIAYVPAGIGVICYNFKKIKKHSTKILKYIPLGIVGSLVGAYLITVFSANVFKKIYGFFLIVYGIYMIFTVIRANFSKKI